MKPDKVAFNAYHLYGLIKLNVVVGETIAKAQEEWASLVPFGEKAIQPALHSTVSGTATALIAVKAQVGLLKVLLSHSSQV